MAFRNQGLSALQLFHFSSFQLSVSTVLLFFSFFKKGFYVFIFGERGREEEGEGEKHQ